MSDWLTGGSLLSIFGAAGVLIWRLVRLGVNQEDRLLKPAYDRIDVLEDRVAQLEEAERRCQRERADYLYLLRSNGIRIPREVV